MSSTRRARASLNLHCSLLKNFDDGQAHFLEMAQTWEMLGDLHVLTQKLKSSGALLTKPTPRAE